jgi:hypothetical protein
VDGAGRPGLQIQQQATGEKCGKLRFHAPIMGERMRGR